MEIIELSGLGVRFGKREILSDLRATLSSRSIGLLGPNGAGKSTLIQALLGFCPISSGTASILGLDVMRDRNRIRSLIGYMPENDALIANMTAVSMVRMMGELSGMHAKAALERAHARFVAVVKGDEEAEAFAAALLPLLSGRVLPAERELVRNVASVIRVTHSFSADEQAALTRCVGIMCKGMPAFQRGKSLHGLAARDAGRSHRAKRGFQSVDDIAFRHLAFSLW